MEADPDRILTLCEWSRVSIPKYRMLKAVLWPVLAYDVLVPEHAESPLDMLQDAVVELAVAGLRDIDRISDVLAQHRDLIEVVVEQLRNLDYLDEYGQPTDLGLDTVQESEISRTRSLPRTVLQDPFTGRLWPIAPMDPSLSGDVVQGKPQTLQLHHPFPLTPVPVPITHTAVLPTPESILIAQDEWLHRREHPDEDVSTALTLLDRDSKPIQRVEFINSLPTAHWMPCVFLLRSRPEDAGGVTGIGVDGFPSRLLVDSLRRAAEKLRVAEAILTELDETARKEMLGPHREYLDRIKSDAVQHVESLVEPDWRESEVTLWHELVDLQSKMLQVEEDPERASALLKDVIVGAGRVAEGTAQVLVQRYPLPDATQREIKSNAKRMAKGKGERVVREILDQAVSSWLEKDTLPDHLFSSDVERSSPNGLMWWLSRVVAGAQFDGSHPLRLLVTENENWVHEIQSVGNMRNRRGAHFVHDIAGKNEALKVGSEAMRLSADALRLMNAQNGA